MKQFTEQKRAGCPLVRGYSLVRLLVWTGLQAGLLPHLQAGDTKMAITDNGISAAVKSDFHFDRPLQPYSLGVTTSQGFVTLSGPVDNLFVRRRAVKIAESVRGVRGRRPAMVGYNDSAFNGNLVCS